MAFVLLLPVIGQIKTKTPNNIIRRFFVFLDILFFPQNCFDYFFPAIS